MIWHDVFRYENGKLFWKIRPRGNVHIGDEAGSPNGDGHLRVMYKRKYYLVHRVIYELHNGPIPKEMQIDHVNGIRDDNRIDNLRLATQSQNNWNSSRRKDNTSGYKGVVWYKPTQKWVARIMVFGKNILLGYFLTKEDAYNARRNAEKFYHGEFVPTEERKSYVAS
jgi:hypothetical protein